MGNKKKSTLGTMLILLALAPFKLAFAQAPLGIAIAVIVAIVGISLLLSSYKNDKEETSSEENE